MIDSVTYTKELAPFKFLMYLLTLFDLGFDFGKDDTLGSLRKVSIT